MSCLQKSPQVANDIGECCLCEEHGRTCSLRLLETNMINSVGEKLGQQRKKENIWMSRIKEELEGLGMEDIWENRRNSNVSRIKVKDALI